MSSQKPTSLAELQKLVTEFRDERNWRQFHSPKNLSMSIAIEAAELMEHFQWLTVEEAANLPQRDSQMRQAIAEELADVLVYCISLADVLELDIPAIIANKMAKNNRKYPADEYRGRF
ncbi:MAG: nucleotide pyrophosphohydrolase [Chloroflexi bacterium]|nr:MAG: nucleotide pyrophosphohydrolase [Chloroflexota bacterium]